MAIIVQAGFSFNSSKQSIQQLATAKERVDKLEQRIQGLEAKQLYGTKR